MNDKVEVIRVTETGGFFRKPETWREVGLNIQPAALENLKQYDASELGIENQIAAPFRVQPTEQVFLVARKNGVYLVDTEGYSYARMVRYVGHAVIIPVPDTLEYVLQAFDNNGMDMRPPSGKPGEDMSKTGGIETATFIGLNDKGDEMYRCTYTDPDDEPDSGVAFVWEKDGKKLADF